ncbi:MAG TPA: hypothetical protein VKU41_09700 [Polyangiaceae bacterium]|nr:hypothetical protein [Polyangiaceae bacterium]
MVPATWRTPRALVVLMTLAGSAGGEPATPPAAARGPVKARPATTAIRASAPSPPPAADVRLEIDATTTHGAWTMRLANRGEVPVRVVADGRLLSLDVTPRGARKAEHCELPQDMRPIDDLDRGLVLPPRGAYLEAVEPRLYCFGAKGAALASGAIVVGHLGWPGRGVGPPLEVSPIDGVTPEVGARKVVDSEPIALPDEPTPSPAPTLAVHDPYATASSKLVIRSAPFSDAEAPDDAAVSVTLSNQGSRAVIVRFRPETLAFDITGPSGIEHCAWPRSPSGATRELFTTLAPKATTSLNLMLSAYCTGHSLDHPGLLVVRAELDTRAASGKDIGLPSFDGVVDAEAPSLVRLHRGSTPDARPLPSTVDH